MKLRDLVPGAITSPHDARLERLTLRDLDRVAAAALRVSTSVGNLQTVRDYPPGCPASTTGEAGLNGEQLPAAG